MLSLASFAASNVRMVMKPLEIQKHLRRLVVISPCPIRILVVLTQNVGTFPAEPHVNGSIRFAIPCCLVNVDSIAGVNHAHIWQTAHDCHVFGRLMARP